MALEAVGSNPITHPSFISSMKHYVTTFGKVAELVDALDLESSGLSSWGFKSPLSHHSKHHQFGGFLLTKDRIRCNLI